MRELLVYTHWSGISSLVTELMIGPPCRSGKELCFIRSAEQSEGLLELCWDFTSDKLSRSHEGSWSALKEVCYPKAWGKGYIVLGPRNFLILGLSFSSNHEFFPNRNLNFQFCILEDQSVIDLVHLRLIERYYRLLSLPSLLPPSPSSLFPPSSHFLSFLFSPVLHEEASSTSLYTQTQSNRSRYSM